MQSVKCKMVFNFGKSSFTRHPECSGAESRDLRTKGLYSITDIVKILRLRNLRLLRSE